MPGLKEIRSCLDMTSSFHFTGKPLIAEWIFGVQWVTSSFGKITAQISISVNPTTENCENLERVEI